MHQQLQRNSQATRVGEHGADVIAKDNNGNTVLHRAVPSDNSETVQWLMQEHGADVTAKNNDGNTALHGAMELGRLGDSAMVGALFPSCPSMLLHALRCLRHCSWLSHLRPCSINHCILSKLPRYAALCRTVFPLMSLAVTPAMVARPHHQYYYGELINSDGHDDTPRKNQNSNALRSRCRVSGVGPTLNRKLQISIQFASF